VEKKLAQGQMSNTHYILDFEVDTFDGAKPRFLNRGKERRFLRHAQDTEFIEVQYQP
jgi:hypothetical protein